MLAKRSSMPKLSVIIPTRNRLAMLMSAVSSIHNQCSNADLVEIIIVDNCSSDGTEDLGKALALSCDNIFYIREERMGLHHARHAGMSCSNSDLLCYIDDDSECIRGWCSALIDVFKDPLVALVGGNCLPVFWGMPPKWLQDLWSPLSNNVRVLSHLSIQEHPPGITLFDPYYVWGCNFAIRKDVLLSAGGFHPDGMPEELIHLRGDGETHVSKYVADNNLKCIFDSRVSVYHKVTPERMTISYFRKRGFNQGVSDSYTSLRKSPEAVQDGHQSLVLNLVPTLKSKLSASLRKTTELITRPSLTLNPAQAAFQEGYQQGFAYHQSIYTSDPKVRAWVHKETYFD